MGLRESKIVKNIIIKGAVYPQEIQSDDDPSLCGGLLFPAFFREQLGVFTPSTAPYYPQFNTVVEGPHRELKIMLMLSLQQGLKLEEATLAAEHALLTAPSTAQSCISPFFLQHGYDPLGGFDLLLSENRVAFNASATLESHLKSLRVARLIALLATVDYQRRADQNDNGRWVRHNFKIGGSVYGLWPKKHGLDVPAYGPYIITQFDPIQKSVAWAADPNDRRNVFRLHVSRLVKLGEVPEELRVAMVPFADVFGDRDAVLEGPQFSRDRKRFATTNPRLNLRFRKDRPRRLVLSFRFRCKLKEWMMQIRSISLSVLIATRI